MGIQRLVSRFARPLGTRRVPTAMVLGCLAGAAWIMASCKAESGEPGPPQVLPIEAQWCLSGHSPRQCIDLEVPASPRQFSMGLQLRPALPPLRGMWFAFSPPSVAKFWMHRTLAPLDLLFIANNRILAIQANAPICPHLPCPSYGPDGPVDGVVELGAGEAERLGLKVGSPVEIRWLPQPATPSKSKRD